MGRNALWGCLIAGAPLAERAFAPVVIPDGAAPPREGVVTRRCLVARPA